MNEIFSVNVSEAAEAQLGGAEVAGKIIAGTGRGRLVTRGTGVMLVHLNLDAGFDQNGHTHADNESIGYVVSGKVRMRVGDVTRVLRAGDTWYHPRGIEHTSEILESAEILEFHAPLRPDLLELFAVDKEQ